VKPLILGASLLVLAGWYISRVNIRMKLFNVHGIDLEIYEHPSGFWHDSRIIFYSDPGDKKQDVIQYLYNEGFIQDRRTPYTIKDFS